MISKEAAVDAIDVTVPIHTKVTANQELLHSLVSDQPVPPDDDKHHSFLKPKSLNPQSKSYSEFDGFVRFCIDGSAANRGPKQLATLRRHFESILLSLSWAMYKRQWVLVALDSHAYSKDVWLKSYGFTHTYTKSVIEYLESKELITVKAGKRYAKKPARTRIYPTELLRRTLWKFFLDSEQPIEPPYVSINMPDRGYGDIIANLDEGHPDLADMTKINEFLKGHQVAWRK